MRMRRSLLNAEYAHRGFGAAAKPRIGAFRPPGGAVPREVVVYSAGEEGETCDARRADAGSAAALPGRGKRTLLP